MHFSIKIYIFFSIWRKFFPQLPQGWSDYIGARKRRGCYEFWLVLWWMHKNTEERRLPCRMCLCSSYHYSTTWWNSCEYWGLTLSVTLPSFAAHPDNGIATKSRLPRYWHCPPNYAFYLFICATSVDRDAHTKKNVR